MDESLTSSCSEGEVDIESEDVNFQKALAKYATDLYDPASHTGPVWSEHSYYNTRRACGTGGPTGCGGTGRAPGPAVIYTLGNARPPRCGHCRSPDPVVLDVVTAKEEPLPPGGENSSDDDDDDDEWEERLSRNATTPARKKLSETVASLMHDLRLAELAGKGVPGARMMARREAARRLRRAVAGGLTDGTAAWIAGELAARRGGSRVLEELCRAAPRLAARFGLTSTQDPWAPPASPPPAPQHAQPTLLWLPSGRDGLDERWVRRVRLLFPVRRIRFQQPERCSVERWTGALLERARAAARGAGSGVVIAGAGAGGALALRVAGTGAGGVLALGPPLLNAEGAPGLMTAPIVPTFIIIGEHSEQGDLAAAGAWAEGRDLARVLIVPGADHLLRRRVRTGPPQHAVDAAIVSEVARWLLRDPPEQQLEPVEMPANFFKALSTPAPEDIMRMPIVFADDELEPVKRGRGRPRIMLD